MANNNTLPSQASAEAFHAGHPDALKAIARDAIGRAAIIYGGIFIAGLLGLEKPQRPFLTSLAGSLAIEAAVLLWTKPKPKQEANVSSSNIDAYTV